MTTEKKPTWVTAVAIIAIIFSSFGILGGTQEIMMPQMLEFQKKMFSTMTEEFKREMENQPAPSDPAAQQIQQSVMDIFEMIEQMFNFPDWYKSWMVISGILSLLINGFYLYAAIIFMQLRRKAIPLIYTAFGLSIALGITKVVVAVNALSAFAMFMMSGGLIAIVIELVLLIVVLTSRKDCFTN